MIRFILPLALLMSVPAHGDMPSMKRQNFELVNFGSAVQDCPFIKEDIAEIWESELLRARLKKNPIGDFEVGYLWLQVDCLEFKEKEDFYQYNYRLEWTWSEKNPDAHLVLGDLSSVYPSVSLDAGMGRGDREVILRTLRDAIARGITAYLKVNLD